MRFRINLLVFIKKRIDHHAWVEQSIGLVVGSFWFYSKHTFNSTKDEWMSLPLLFGDGSRAWLDLMWSLRMSAMVSVVFSTRPIVLLSFVHGQHVKLLVMHAHYC